LTDEQIQTLAQQRIFLGHQSVGDNLVQGIRDIMATDGRLHLNIIQSRNPEAVSSPAFVEAHVGQNTQPASKNSDFLAILSGGFEGIAMLKYCYVDINEKTEVQQMFDAYQATVETVRRNHPAIRIVHVTVPLTTVESGAKAWLKGVLGRNTAQMDNIKRNHFNQLLLRTYSQEPIFDLARVESTRSDGSRSSFNANDEVVYTLAPEYTTDGGHLNQKGRDLAAERLLEVLASVH